AEVREGIGRGGGRDPLLESGVRVIVRIADADGGINRIQAVTPGPPVRDAVPVGVGGVEKKFMRADVEGGCAVRVAIEWTRDAVKVVRHDDAEIGGDDTDVSARVDAR